MNQLCCNLKEREREQKTPENKALRTAVLGHLVEHRMGWQWQECMAGWCFRDSLPSSLTPYLLKNIIPTLETRLRKILKTSFYKEKNIWTQSANVCVEQDYKGVMMMSRHRQEGDLGKREL